jgi:predicted nucleic acid-binding protein
MIDPATGPFVFDTTAESYLSPPPSNSEAEWLQRYAALFPVYVAVISVVERARGYFLARDRCPPPRRVEIERYMMAYVQSLSVPPTRVLDLTTAVGLLSAQMMSMLPAPPSPPVRSHRLTESRQDRLSRWRFDIMIAATALVHDMPLIHNNPQDFEPMRALIETVPERFPGVGPLNLISVKRLAA